MEAPIFQVVKPPLYEEEVRCLRTRRLVAYAGLILYRSIRWFGAAFGVVAISVVSTVFPDIGWAETLEKFLILLFTATVVTEIGLTAAHAEKKVLWKIACGMRQIVSADADGNEFSAAALCALQSARRILVSILHQSKQVGQYQQTWNDITRTGCAAERTVNQDNFGELFVI